MKLNRGHFYFLLFFFLVACSSEKGHELTGKKFPSFKVENLKGKVVSLLPQKLDKPVLVNVWATWCAPCVKELPSLEALAKEGNFSVIALSMDAKPAQVQKFVDKYQFSSIKVLFDAFGQKSRSKLKAQALPITFVIDTNAVVKQVVLGEKNWMDKTFQAHLFKKVGYMKK